MSLDIFRLDNRVAIVTGGSKGLGKAIAKALAGAGANVTIVSRNLNEAEASADEISDDTDKKVLALEIDVSKQPQVKEMVTKTVAEFGKVDILVNNAGINIRGPAEELTLNVWSQILNINLIGPFLCSQAVFKYMSEQKYGRIINVASILGIVGMPGRTAYSSSKGGLIQFTKTLALEWAQYNITVNAICPGPFMTEINRPLLNDPEAYQAFASKVPMGRWGEPEELGGVAIFLASDASSFATGSAVYVDGGWTAQ